MHHRADDKDSSWLDDLVRSEMDGKTASAPKDDFVAPELGDRNPFGNSILDKIAADEDPNAQMDDIEKKIESANSVEELDQLEDQLKNIQTGEGDSGGDAGTALADGQDPMAAEMGTAPGAAAGSPDVTKKLDEIDKKLDDKAQATQEQTLIELKKLNESMGNDKPVDMNNTIDQGS